MIPVTHTGQTAVQTFKRMKYNLSVFPQTPSIGNSHSLPRDSSTELKTTSVKVAFMLKKTQTKTQTTYMSQLNHGMNASEKLEDHKKNSSKNECRKSKISIVQYSELLLKSKHKPFAASARRGTDTLPFKDAVHSQGSASTKSSADIMDFFKV